MSFFLLMFGFACGFVVGWYWSGAFYRKSAAPANGFTPPYPMPPAARPSWARPEDEDGVGGTPAPSIPATWQHDAGAYARCSFCLRYTRNPKALSHSSFLCDCGSAEGWSGSFKPPGPDARWLAASGVKEDQRG
jgi:hypothetical protein